jgi:intraflagellar transport protein 172
MYLIVEEYDLGIAMYKKCQQYDNMIRMVSKYRSNLLKETHLAVAQKLHKDGNFKTAEQHYISAGAWRAAVEMYKSQNLWEEAVRTSKLYGKDEFTCELAKKWAESLGPEQGMKMMLKMNLVDAVVEYLSDKAEFDEAFKMANLHAKHKIRDVHLKFAFKLEDEKRYKEAEVEFVKAGKAQEAISMYENIGDFHSALTVASQYEPQARDSILINQAKSFIEGNKREYPKAEAAYITARKP